MRIRARKFSNSKLQNRVLDSSSAKNARLPTDSRYVEQGKHLEVGARVCVVLIEAGSPKVTSGSVIAMRESGDVKVSFDGGGDAGEGGESGNGGGSGAMAQA